MSPTAGRRQFLEQLGRSGAALAAGSWLASFGFVAAAAGPARAVINQAQVRSELDRRLLGAFLEHLGRAIYTGVYEPGSPLADGNGFRNDVLAEVKGLGVPIMRYPGGNFVSGYNWLDGVGPEERAADRARAGLELARDQSVRHQRVHRVVQAGRHRAAARRSTSAPARPRRPSPTSSTAMSTRARSGATCAGRTATSSRTTCATGASATRWTAPGRWATMPAREYGRKARDTARQMRVLDRSCQLIACGSSNTILPTYLVWDREVLEECYDQVDAHLAAQLLRQHAGADRQQQRALPGDEPRHGAADPRDRRRLRLRAGAAQVAQAAVAVVRRMERLVSGPRRRRSPTASGRSRRSCSRRSTTWRTRCSSAAS